jgi:hypothetical protein
MRRIAILAAATIAGLLTVSAHADPARYRLITIDPNNPPKVGLNGVVKIRVEPDNETDLDPRQFALKAEGILLGEGVGSDGTTVSIKLQRFQPNEANRSGDAIQANRSEWMKLIGRPFTNSEPETPITIEYKGKVVPFAPGVAGDSANPDAAKSPKISVINYGVGALFGIVLALAVIVATALACWKWPLIRDGLIPQMRIKERSFSLGRFQMAVWFCVIMASFLFIAAFTFDLQSITQESFVLMGIAGATGLGAIVVDQKDSPQMKTRQDLDNLGLKTATDVEALDEANKNPDNAAKPAKNFVANVALSANPEIPVKELVQKFDTMVAPFKRDSGKFSFFGDLVNDATGPTLYRWQILAWTVVLALIYIWRVYDNLEVPSLGTNLLTLMGISSSVYLGFKIPEKQG